MKLCGLLVLNLGSPVGSKSKLMATIKAIEEGALEMDRREDDRSTRESYKDKHKDRAFAMMKNAKSNLQLHHRPVERAQELFAAFRNAREKVQKEDLVIAACLVLAHREVRVNETLTLSSASSSSSSSSAAAAPMDSANGAVGKHVQLSTQELAEIDRRKKEQMLRTQELRRKREREIMEKHQKMADEVEAMANLATSHSTAGNDGSDVGWTAMAKWDENRVRRWLRAETAESWTAETVATWPKLDPSSSEMIPPFLAAVQSPAWLDTVVAKILRPGKGIGQSLVLVTEPKIAEAIRVASAASAGTTGSSTPTQASSAITKMASVAASVLFRALATEKRRNKEKGEIYKKALAKRQRTEAAKRHS